jgi:hypothetical protein
MLKRKCSISYREPSRNSSAPLFRDAQFRSQESTVNVIDHRSSLAGGLPDKWMYGKDGSSI